MHTLERARHVGIWGFGREGQAAYQFLRRSYPHIDITVLNDAPLPDEVTAGGDFRTITGERLAAALRPANFDLVIKSPAISIYREDVSRARQEGVRFTSATNLWFQQYPGAKTIAVTGTKGKSTSVRLLHYLLSQSKLDVALLGNVGIPALGHEPGRDYTVLELSSYQIADLEHAPTIALVTTLFRDHVPWHRTEENYFRDKLRILSLDNDTKAICNAANENLRRLAPRRPDIHWYNADAGWRVADGHLHFDGARVDCSGFPLKGEHNLDNLAGVCAVADLVGLTQLRQGVDARSFEQLPHRMDEFYVGAGLLCVDDSISTIPEATRAALNAYPDRETVLLLGGTDRGQDYHELMDFLCRSRVRCAVLIPPSGSRIATELSGRSLPFEVVSAASFENAVQEGLRRAPQEGMILLSPGAPSFGEFQNFEERGNAFKTLCRRHAALIGSQAHAVSQEH